MNKTLIQRYHRDYQKVINNITCTRVHYHDPENVAYVHYYVCIFTLLNQCPWHMKLNYTFNGSYRIAGNFGKH